MIGMQKKVNKKILLFIISFLFLFVSFSPLVFGDGGAFIQPSIDKWVTLEQEKQIGIINFDDGYEKLILVISVRNSSLEGDRVFWIFPVPANHTDVNIDILSNTPSFSGEDVKDLAKEKLNDLFPFLYMSQIYILPPTLFFYINSNMMMPGSKDGSGYQIYSHLEEMGMTTEKVGAKNSESFQNYLDSNNVSLTNKANSIIDEYIEKKYCFVVSWISDVESFRENATSNNPYSYEYYYNPQTHEKDPLCVMGVSINFPTDQIYYPLKLTSVYENETVPIYLQVLGHVKPKIYPDFNDEGFIKTDYFLEEEYYIQDNLKTFFSEQINKKGERDEYYDLMIKNLEYTEIEINTKAKNLNKDLWIEDKAPADVQAASFMASNALLIMLFIFVFASCISSLFAGLIIYKKQKPSLLKFTLFGLSNFLGFIGFFLLCFYFKIDKLFLNESKNEKKFDNEVSLVKVLKWPSIFLLVLIFMGVFIIFSGSISIFGILLLILVLFVLPFFGVSVIFIYGYKKDRQKTKFVLLFSLFFIGIIFAFHLFINFIV